jgi:hypothetical protein
LRGE